LEGIRKIIPVEKVCGSIKGYSLDFLEGIPYVEPGMGTICKDEEGEIHGLLIKLTGKDFDKLYETEGGALGGYKLTEVKVKAYDGRTISAYAFESKYGLYNDVYFQPSKRYYNIVREGAIECKMDQKYLDYLEKEVKPFEGALWKKIVFGLFNFPIFLFAFSLFFVVRLLWRFSFCEPLLKLFNIFMPRFFNFIKMVLWIEYKYLWQMVLGNGGKHPRKRILKLN